MTATTDRPTIKARALAAYQRQREQHAEAEAEAERIKIERLTEALHAEMQALGVDRDEYEVFNDCGRVVAQLDTNPEVFIGRDHNGVRVAVRGGVYRFTSVKNFWANLGAWLSGD